MDKEKDLYEQNQYEDADFPVGIYTVTKRGITPKGRGYMDLHWHEELQFTIVMEGKLKIRVNTQEYYLQKGEAIFINRNMLHITTDLTNDGVYVSLNFPDKLLCFFAGSRMEQNDVYPFTVNGMPMAKILRQDEAWQREVIEILSGTVDSLKKDRMNGNEYMISMNLTKMWYLMVLHMRKELIAPTKGDVRKQNRMRVMLSYIHEKYMEDLRLADIAETAGVSAGECCRCFRQVIGKSPNQYLLEYRVARSKEYLTTTELSVTEVAFAVGFNDSSNFIHYFKKLQGITPVEYRKEKS